jgi:hypothetical protein
LRRNGEEGLTIEKVPRWRFLGGVAHRWGARGVVGARAGRDAERQGGVELEEVAIGWSSCQRRLAPVASSWRMERAMMAFFEQFFTVVLWGSRMFTLGDDGDVHRGCNWWREVRWHGLSTVAEECTEQSGAGGKAWGERWHFASPYRVKW